MKLRFQMVKLDAGTTQFENRFLSTFVLHFKQVFFLVVAHLKLRSSQKSSMFRGCDRHYIET